MKKSTCIIVTDRPSKWVYYKEMLEEFEGVTVSICRTIAEIDKYLDEKKYSFSIISNTMREFEANPFNAGADEITPIFEKRSIPYVLLSTTMEYPNTDNKNLGNCIYEGLMVTTNPSELVKILKEHKLL